MKNKTKVCYDHSINTCCDYHTDIKISFLYIHYGRQEEEMQFKWKEYLTVKLH